MHSWIPDYQLTIETLFSRHIHIDKAYPPYSARIKKYLNNVFSEFKFIYIKPQSNHYESNDEQQLLTFIWNLELKQSEQQESTCFLTLLKSDFGGLLQSTPKLRSVEVISDKLVLDFENAQYLHPSYKINDQIETFKYPLAINTEQSAQSMYLDKIITEFLIEGQQQQQVDIVLKKKHYKLYYLLSGLFFAKFIYKVCCN